MDTVTCDTTSSLRSAVQADGFAFVHGRALRAMLESIGSLADWNRFADSWNELEIDFCMADGGRYRRRRYAVYECRTAACITRQPHQPHYQPVDYNPLNGGVSRWFEPVETDVGESATMRTILGSCHALFVEPGRPNRAWHVEVHQFRIEALRDEVGRPTPEGLHRDGVDYVLVLLIQRLNLADGTTMIYGAGGRHLGHFTLTDPFDAALVDDSRVFHGVTPVRALDPQSPAHRDVLVVTFAAAGPDARRDASA